MVLYAGLPAAVFKSTDGGGTWSPAGLADMRISVIAVVHGPPTA